MKAGNAILGVRGAPHLHGPRRTERVMFDVLVALTPAGFVAVYLFGISAVLLMATCVLTCLGVEYLYGRRRGGRTTIGDYSAIVTGLLLALTLPPACPLWMGVGGSAFAMAVGKFLFGGLGANLFNLALVGRAFLQAAFPTAMTTWAPALAPERFARPFAATLTPPLLAPRFEKVDALSGATPLAAMKWEGLARPFAELFLGTHAGSLGETSAAALLTGGLYLVWRGALNWRTPLAIFTVVAILSAAARAYDPGRYAGALVMLCSGGLMLGAWFMATDPVTSPVTIAGAYLFGGLIGLLVVVIRFLGGLPEGVMYAILLSNAAVPLIDRMSQARVYGNKGRTRYGG